MADLTEAEAAVYDRQLRVWGVDTQKRLNASRILIVNCTGLAAEVAKNIVLAGVGSLTLMDGNSCSERSAGNFLVPFDAEPSASVAEVSAATLQEMNPLVKVQVRPKPVTESVDGLSLVMKDYDVVVLTGSPSRIAQNYDEAVGEKPSVEKEICFTPLGKSLAVPWSKLNPRRTHKLYFALRVASDFEWATDRFPTAADLPALKQLRADIARLDGVDAGILPDAVLEQYARGESELAPVNAIVGGVLANEVLKAVSKKGDPVNNFFFYMLSDGVGSTECMSNIAATVPV